MTIVTLSLLLAVIVALARNAVYADAQISSNEEEESQQKKSNNARNTTRSSSTAGNCAAGGSGYGIAFDYTRADTVGLHWINLPKERHTVEYWYRHTDPHLSQQAILAYSAYNVRGFQGKGGLPYEAANELLFMINREFISLWRGTGRIDLHRNVNPRISDMWSDGWHHFAYSYDSAIPQVAFFLDGEQLDFATATIGDGLDYEKAPFSSDWDVAENPDAADYYGSFRAQVQTISNPCEAFSLSKNSTENPDNKVAVLIANDNSCPPREQARRAQKAGAWAIIFHRSNGTDSIFADNSDATKKLKIPVVAVDYATGKRIEANRTITFVRSRYPGSYKDSFRYPVEGGGVLALGQEPDKPWGDFDPFQAADGVLDELRVWDVVRTPKQIRDNCKLSIDVGNDPEAKHLNTYWNFDALPSGKPLPQTPDLSPGNANPGLFGNLPTIANEMTYADGSPRKPPSSPLRIPTTASPLVGRGEVVVPVAAGQGLTVFELKSHDPDGDDLLTKIVTLPSNGTMYMVDGSFTPLAPGDVVIDNNRRQNKRVAFAAPTELDSDVLFTYSVEDGGVPVNATVRLVPHVVEDPVSDNTTIQEDTLTFFSLSRPSQLTQRNLQVEITVLPEKGTLYQAQFDPDIADHKYTTLATLVDQFGPMDKITQAGTIVANDRGVLLYMPEQDEASETPETVYASFRYRFIDPEAGGLSSNEAVRSVVVSPVNDLPVSLPGNASVAVGGTLTIALESTDVDADALESFATRPFARITTFPRGGRVYQYNESADDLRGAFMDSSVTAVPQTFAWASRVVRHSSQFSQCGASCFSWRNHECPSNDVLSGGTATGTCSDTAWMSSNILGPPDVYPQYADAKKGWDLGEENVGDEFIELEFPFPVYVNAFELYETFKPGSVWKISTAAEYKDDPDESCLRRTCSKKTDWWTLWTKPQETVTLGPERATIFAPAICPSTVKSKLIRLDLDTARAPGWNNFDAAKITGSLNAPPGLVDDASNRLLYAPLDGVHGIDRLSFASSDCLGEGESSIYTISIEPPAEGELSPSVFYEDDLTLALQPGEVESYEVDLSLLLDKIQPVLQAEPDLTAELVFSSALGSRPGVTYTNISLARPTLSMEIGVENRGTPFSFIELWLHDRSGLVFRVRYRTILQLGCVNGMENEEKGVCRCTTARWTANDCSVEVQEDRNQIPSYIRGVAYAFFAVNVILCLSFLAMIYINRNATPVKVSQPLYLCLLLFGCFLTSSTILALGAEGSDVACWISPWCLFLGMAIMFGSLFAKILRVYKLLRNGLAMKKRPVTMQETVAPIIILLVVNSAVLACWTAMDPLTWQRETLHDDGEGYILSSVGQCHSESETHFLVPLVALNIALLIFALILCYVARDVPDEFQEGKFVALSIFGIFEIYLIGIPVLLFVGDDPTTAFFVQSAIIFLVVFPVLLLIFGSLAHSVYFKNKGESPMKRRASLMAESVHRRGTRVSGIDMNSRDSYYSEAGSYDHEYPREQARKGKRTPAAAPAPVMEGSNELDTSHGEDHSDDDDDDSELDEATVEAIMRASQRFSVAPSERSFSEGSGSVRSFDFDDDDDKGSGGGDSNDKESKGKEMAARALPVPLLMNVSSDMSLEDSVRDKELLFETSENVAAEQDTSHAPTEATAALQDSVDSIASFPTNKVQAMVGTLHAREESLRAMREKYIGSAAERTGDRYGRRQESV